MKALLLGLALLAIACQQGPTAASVEGGESAAQVIAAPAKPRTTSDIVAALKTSGMISDSVVYTASTDPNSLLGRPGQYSEKANFQIERIAQSVPTNQFTPQNGGSVEIFPDEALAKARLDYFIGLSRSGNALVGTEYDYQHGKMVLRLSSKLTPDEAAAFDASFAKMVA